MQQREHKPQLFLNRGAAAIGVVLTGYVAALTFRAAFSQSPHRFHWILPLDYMLPSRAVWTVNVAFYLALFWLCIAFTRTLEGKERVLVTGWVPGVLLSPIQGMVSVSLAAAIQYVKAVSILVAFVAAVLILLEGPPNANAPPDSSVPE